MFENIVKIEVGVWWCVGAWVHIEKLPSEDVYPDV